MQLPASMNDDDVDAWNDILYLRGLLDSLHNACIETRRPAPAFPPGLSLMLDIALDLVRNDDYTIEIYAPAPAMEPGRLPSLCAGCDRLRRHPSGETA